MTSSFSGFSGLPDRNTVGPAAFALPCDARSRPIHLLSKLVRRDSFEIKSDIMTSDEDNPRTAVLINLYNYGKHVCEAIDSALGQSTGVDEVLVVDDGSTDDGPEKIESRYAGNAAVRLIRKPNEGQLSSMEIGVLEASGDVLFFLDADDLWERKHVENYLHVFEHFPDVDFVFSGYREFGKSTRRNRPHKRDIHLGKSVLTTIYGRAYIGSITSCIAMKRSFACSLFPVSEKIKALFRINGDALLVYGASICGATKYYVDSDTVRYRIHGANNYAGDSKKRYDEIIRYRSLIEHLRKRADIPHELRFDFYREFESIPHPDARCYRKAKSILKYLTLPLTCYCRTRIRIARHYLKNRNPVKPDAET